MIDHKEFSAKAQAMIGKILLRGGTQYMSNLNDMALDMLNDAFSEQLEEDDASFESMVLEEVRTAIATRLREQEEDDRGESDCDRYAAAQAALASQGICLEADFTCCNTCGHAEIGDSIAKMEQESGNKVWGYGFYHQQDTECAVDGGGVMLGFSKWQENDNRSASDLATAIVSALKQEGLEASWGGDVGRKIDVPMPDFRRNVQIVNDVDNN